MTKKFDLEKFTNALELDEELAMADIHTKDRNSKGVAYRACPRCGSRQWKILNVNELGRAISCDRCEQSEQ
jgi:transcription elongation factor Elf1